eukprot:Clim_evm15s136 gene=Clim_evmTU15s136
MKGSEAQKIAAEAEQAFEAKKYDECLKHLSQIQLPDNRRLQYNKELAVWMQSAKTHSGKGDRTALFRSAIEAGEKLRELARDSQATDKPSTKDNGKKSKDDGTGPTEDTAVELATCAYTAAVLLRSQGQRSAAIDLLKPIISSVDELDETTAKLCLLLYQDLLMESGRFAEAAELWSPLEKALMSEHVEDGDDTNDNAKETGSPQQAATGDFKTRDGTYVMRTQRARLCLMNRNLKQCKRELKAAIQASKDSPGALFFKSQLEFLRGNMRKSLKLLNICPKTNPDGTVDHYAARNFYSNMASVYHKMGKHGMAALCVKKAVNHNNELLLQSSGMAEEGEMNAILAYKSGLEYLHLKRFEDAYESFDGIRDAYCFSPHLWIRLAECCVSYQLSIRGKEPVHVVGEGALKRLVIIPGHATMEARNKRKDMTYEDARRFADAALFLLDDHWENSNGNSGTPKNMASVNGDRKEGTDLTGVMKFDEKDNLYRAQLPDGSYVRSGPLQWIRTEEHDKILTSARLLRCYVALETGEYDLAQSLADRTMQNDNSFPPHLRALALCYQIAAVVHKGDTRLALDLLSKQSIQSLVDTISEQEAQLESNQTTAAAASESTSPAAAVFRQHSLQLNTAVLQASAYMVDDRVDDAYQSITQAMTVTGRLGIDFPRHAALVAAYVFLARDDLKGAQSVLKPVSIMAYEEKERAPEMQYLWHYRNPDSPTPNMGSMGGLRG